MQRGRLGACRERPCFPKINTVARCSGLFPRPILCLISIHFFAHPPESCSVRMPGLETEALQSNKGFRNGAQLCLPTFIELRICGHAETA